MIHFLVTARHAYTVESYLASGGAPLIERVRLFTYEQVAGLRGLPAGTWILADLDRLPSRHRALAAAVAAAVAADPRSRLLNHPERCLARYALLQRLRAAGINEHAVHRLRALPTDLRLPVFLRLENDHQGTRSYLLESRAALDEAAARLVRRGKSKDDMIVVEFCDTSDAEGMFRKYGAFCVAGRIVSRHLFFGRRWHLKSPSNHLPEHFAEERAYVDRNPHVDVLQQVFEIAGTEYGRVDYGLRDGRVVVWEINTNPMISFSGDLTTGPPGETNRRFHEQFREALLGIDDDTDPRATLPLGAPRRGIGDRLGDTRALWRRARLRAQGSFGPVTASRSTT